MIPASVIRIRQKACKLCVDKAHDPCAKCDHAKWGRYQATGCLGTKIESIAQPVAQFIDQVFDTNVATCGGCKQSKEDLDAGKPVLTVLADRLKSVLAPSDN